MSANDAGLVTVVTNRARIVGQTVSAVALVTCLLLSGPVSAVDFKGIELGQPLRISQERSVFGTLDCNPLEMSTEEYGNLLQEMQQFMPGVRKICAGSTSIAMVPADVTVLLGASRRVLRLTFQIPGEDFQEVLEAMTSRWGDGIMEVDDGSEESVWWDFEDGSSVSAHESAATGGEEGDEARKAIIEYSIPPASPATDL